MWRLCLTVLMLAPCATAQRTYEPARGTSERSALLDAVRADARRTLEVRGAIEFHDVRIQSTGTWAHVTATPRATGGGSKSHCASYADDYGDAGDPQIDALLYRTGSRWDVISSGSCATDVWYIGWPSQYGAPAAIVGGAPPPTFPLDGTVADSDDGFLSLRSEPSIQRGQRLARMPARSSIRVQSCAPAPERVDGDWGRWCRVRYDGQTGWAFSAYLTLW